MGTIRHPVVEVKLKLIQRHRPYELQGDTDQCPQGRHKREHGQYCVQHAGRPGRAGRRGLLGWGRCPSSFDSHLRWPGDGRRGSPGRLGGRWSLGRGPGGCWPRRLSRSRNRRRRRRGRWSGRRCGQRRQLDRRRSGWLGRQCNPNGLFLRLHLRRFPGLRRASGGHIWRVIRPSVYMLGSN